MISDPEVAAADTDEVVAASEAKTEADLCFSARALAQTHPMTAVSHRYRQKCIERERRQQPVRELADWAGTSLLVGYCLRRCEEQAVLAIAGSGISTGVNGDETDTETNTEATASNEVRSEDVDLHRVNALSESLRTGDPASVTLLEADLVVGALDRLIATELDKRHEHMREQLDDEAWTELGDYLAWWVIHGYALRASE